MMGEMNVLGIKKNVSLLLDNVSSLQFKEADKMSDFFSNSRFLPPQILFDISKNCFLYLLFYSNKCDFYNSHHLFILNVFLAFNNRFCFWYENLNKKHRNYITNDTNQHEPNHLSLTLLQRCIRLVHLTQT